jgi:hypothetical protein
VSYYLNQQGTAEPPKCQGNYHVFTSPSYLYCQCGWMRYPQGEQRSFPAYNKFDLTLERPEAEKETTKRKKQHTER